MLCSSSLKRASFLIASTLLHSVVTAAQTSMTERYQRAEEMLSWNTAKLVVGEIADVHWLPDGNRLWYRVTTPRGKEFMFADAERDTRNLVFENIRLAEALSKSSGTKVDGQKLPFTEIEFVESDKVIEFDIQKKRFRCDVSSYQCSETQSRKRLPSHVLSPDKEWEAFVKDYNLFIRAAAGDDPIRLTDDGVRYWAYGTREPWPA